MFLIYLFHFILINLLIYYCSSRYMHILFPPSSEGYHLMMGIKILPIEILGSNPILKPIPTRASGKTIKPHFIALKLHSLHRTVRIKESKNPFKMWNKIYCFLYLLLHRPISSVKAFQSCNKLHL